MTRSWDDYRPLSVKKHCGLAKVAVARKLAQRLYWMLRQEWDYTQLTRAVMRLNPRHSVVGGK